MSSVLPQGDNHRNNPGNAAQKPQRRAQPCHDVHQIGFGHQHRNCRGSGAESAKNRRNEVENFAGHFGVIADGTEIGLFRSERPQPQNSVHRVHPGEDSAADQVFQGFGGAAAEGAVAGAAVEAGDREFSVKP